MAEQKCKRIGGRDPDSLRLDLSCRIYSRTFSVRLRSSPSVPVRSPPIVSLESGEVGTELRNTLGGGKTQESRNVEGTGKRKERKCGKRGKVEKRNVIG